MNVQRLATFLKTTPSVSMYGLSYTTTSRRVHYPYRVAVASSDVSQVGDTLKSLIELPHVPITPSIPPKIAFLFTGQGSQYSALGRKLWEHSKQYRSNIEDFDAVAQCQGFPSFLPLIDGSIEDVQTFPPVVVQLGVCCIQIALSRVWEAWGVRPDLVIGHSLGEYAALAISGVISIADTIYLVGKRALLQQSDCSVNTHAMLAAKASVCDIQYALGDLLSGSERDGIEIACVNGPVDTVLSGTVENIVFCDGCASKPMHPAKCPFRIPLVSSGPYTGIVPIHCSGNCLQGP